VTRKTLVAEAESRLEGAEAFVPLLDAVYRTASSGGASNVVMTMPHRGRLNVLTGLLKYPLAALFHKVPPSLRPLLLL
jgi:probable 2-oxoglutarate dehydrogenase E1 component DHKTD1